MVGPSRRAAVARAMLADIQSDSAVHMDAEALSQTPLPPPPCPLDLARHTTYSPL